MKTEQQNLFTCQTGYEIHLRDELCESNVVIEKVEPGHVQFTGESVPDLCFALMGLERYSSILDHSLNVQAAQICNIFLEHIKEQRIEEAWPLLFRAAPSINGLSKRANSVEKEVRKRLKKKAARLIRLAQSECGGGSRVYEGLFVYFSDFDAVHVATRAWIGGQRRMADDPRAPSRSYLKVEEAFQILGFAPQQGETAVDLGAAPGGWSYSAAQRGAQVTSIDNGPLKDGALAHANITHMRGDAFKFQPRNDITYDWLLCDLVEEPHHVIRLMESWFQQGWCRHFVINLKFGRANVMDLIHLIQSPSGLASHCSLFRIRHLFHDREEITLIGTLNSHR